MDRETAKKKRFISDSVEEIEDDSLQTQPKRTRPSFLNRLEAQSVILAEALSPEQVAIVESFIRKVVHEAVENQVNSYNRSILSKNSQLSNRIGKESILEFETSKFKLFFLNQTDPTIFTNNEIEAQNGKPLLVAICDTTTNSNVIIKTGPLSSAMVELVVLNGDFGSSQQWEADTSWSASDFNKNIVSRREGKRPLITGNEMMVYLKNGVGFVEGFSFSDNSSWTRSKKFRLGAKVADKRILVEFPRIGEAVSEAFRVMDHRGETYKKHHPPSREDEVWRLEGIGKDGVYHTRLSSKDIKTVDDFLKTYHKPGGPPYIRKLLGERVPQMTWKKMISNALECDAPFAALDGEQKNFNDGCGLSEGLFSDAEFEKTFVGNYEAMGEGAFERMGEQRYNFIFDDNDYRPLLLLHEEASTSHNHNHEVENASTYDQYYQGQAWDVLGPKSK